jgi:hypothetical protein
MEKSITRKNEKQPAWGDPFFPDFLFLNYTNEKNSTTARGAWGALNLHN